MDVKEIVKEMRLTESIIARETTNAILDFENKTGINVTGVELKMDMPVSGTRAEIKIKNPFDREDATKDILTNLPVDPWGLKK